MSHFGPNWLDFPTSIWTQWLSCEWQDGSDYNQSTKHVSFNNCIRRFYHTEKRNPEHKATFQKKQCQDCDQVHTKLDHKCTRFLPNVIYTQNHCYQTALLPNVISNQNHCYQTALLQNDFYQRTLLPNEFYKWHYHQTALLKNEFLFLIKIR